MGAHASTPPSSVSLDADFTATLPSSSGSIATLGDSCNVTVDRALPLPPTPRILEELLTVSMHEEGTEARQDTPPTSSTSQWRELGSFSQPEAKSTYPPTSSDIQLVLKTCKDGENALHAFQPSIITMQSTNPAAPPLIFLSTAAPTSTTHKDICTAPKCMKAPTIKWLWKGLQHTAFKLRQVVTLKAPLAAFECTFLAIILLVVALLADSWRTHRAEGPTTEGWMHITTDIGLAHLYPLKKLTKPNGTVLFLYDRPLLYSTANASMYCQDTRADADAIPYHPPSLLQNHKFAHKSPSYFSQQQVEQHSSVLLDEANQTYITDLSTNTKTRGETLSSHSLETNQTTSTRGLFHPVSMVPPFALRIRDRFREEGGENRFWLRDAEGEGVYLNRTPQVEFMAQRLEKTSEATSTDKPLSPTSYYEATFFLGKDPGSIGTLTPIALSLHKYFLGPTLFQISCRYLKRLEEGGTFLWSLALGSLVCLVFCATSELMFTIWQKKRLQWRLFNTFATPYKGISLVLSILALAMQTLYVGIWGGMTDVAACVTNDGGIDVCTLGSSFWMSIAAILLTVVASAIHIHLFLSPPETITVHLTEPHTTQVFEKL